MENNPIKQIDLKINTDNIKAEMKKLVDAENKIVELESQHEEDQKYREYYDKNTGHGTIPLTSDMRAKESNGRNNSQKEFDSVEEMIEYCRIHDKSSYEALKKQSFEAIPKNNFDWSDTFTKDEKGNLRSLIGRTLDRANQDLRRKNGFRE